jgi:hypothetical protein
MDELNNFLKLWDDDYPTTGGVFYRRFLPGGLISHFAVRVNEKNVIEWTEREVGKPGFLRINSYRSESYEWPFHRVMDTNLLERQRIRKNITKSFNCFDQKWIYSLWGWNCEHWARLVTTGQPVSYQTKGIIAMTIGHFENPDAVRVLRYSRVPIQSW